MGIITAVTPQQKNKNRVNVFIDDEFACGLSLFTATKFGIKAGKEISAETLDSVVFDSEVGVCFDVASKNLGSHRKTVKEMSEYLSKKGFADNVVEVVIAKLSEYRYLDDVSFARDYISTYGKKFGERKLRYELKIKGVNADIIDEAFAVATGNEDAALVSAQKYMRTHKKADKRKLYGYLLSKGFLSEEIGAVVENMDFGEEDK